LSVQAGAPAANASCKLTLQAQFNEEPIEYLIKFERPAFISAKQMMFRDFSVKNFFVNNFAENFGNGCSSDYAIYSINKKSVKIPPVVWVRR